MLRRSLLFYALAWLCLPAPAWTAPAPEALIVGMELAYPPFEMADTQGKPAGVSVDLAHALGEHLGRPVQIQNLPFDGLIPSLKTGRIHLIISSMTATPERAHAVAFSDPYLTTGLCLLVGKNAPVQGIEDLDQKGRIIVVKQGTTGHLFSRGFKNAQSGSINLLRASSSCLIQSEFPSARQLMYVL